MLGVTLLVGLLHDGLLGSAFTAVVPCLHYESAQRTLSAVQVVERIILRFQ